MSDESNNCGDEKRDLRRRTMAFALQIVRLYRELPRNGEAHIIGGQVLRSGTAPGAHYREACRARSPAEFISKMETALQELDETDYWLELAIKAEVVADSRIRPIAIELQELISIFTASVRTAKRRNGNAG